MSHDIRDIINRLAQIQEAQTTPVKLTTGLNKQQRSVPQLPALFKPRSIKALGSKTDPEHPMKGYAVGGAAESLEHSNALAEAMAEIEEDMISKVKRDLTAYLDKLERKVSVDKDLTDKAKDAVRKRRAEEEEVQEDPTTQEPESDSVVDPNTYPVTAESMPIRSYMLENGETIECWGNDKDGYTLRSGDRSMATKFPNLNHADIAVKLWQKHRSRPNTSTADYLDEK